MEYIEGYTEEDIQATAEQRAKDCGCGDVALHLAEAREDYGVDGPHTESSKDGGKA